MGGTIFMSWSYFGSHAALSDAVVVLLSVRVKPSSCSSPAFPSSSSIFSSFASDGNHCEKRASKSMPVVRSGASAAAFAIQRVGFLAPKFRRILWPFEDPFESCFQSKNVLFK
jgi:hypothetical protein